ncbi:unnamed protein product, partial [Brachionus calyciflorus]
ASDNYLCLCAPGFIGINCETELDACAKNPCQNGAKCHVTIDNAFVCN